MSLLWYAHFYFFFFNDTATTEIYTLSLHDALPIWYPSFAAAIARIPDPVPRSKTDWAAPWCRCAANCCRQKDVVGDRKSTRLNSSHGYISYAVFCLKKKNITATSAGNGTNNGIAIR